MEQSRQKRDSVDTRPPTSFKRRENAQRCAHARPWLLFISNTAWRYHSRIGLRLFGLLAAFSTLGCGQTTEYKHAKATRKSPVGTSPPKAIPPSSIDESTGKFDDKLAMPHDEDGKWTPMTGSEQVIIDKLPLLTDGADVQIAPVERDTKSNEKPRGPRN